MGGDGATAVDSGGRAGPADARPPFESMIRRHRAGAAFQRHYGTALAVFGLLVLILGLLDPALRLPGLTVGLLALALSLLPFHAARAERERAEGLDVLAEEWATGSAGERRRLTALLTKLHR